jgi:hypothetical protein
LTFLQRATQVQKESEIERGGMERRERGRVQTTENGE